MRLCVYVETVSLPYRC